MNFKKILILPLSLMLATSTLASCKEINGVVDKILGIDPPITDVGDNNSNNNNNNNTDNGNSNQNNDNQNSGNQDSQTQGDNTQNNQGGSGDTGGQNNNDTENNGGNTQNEQGNTGGETKPQEDLSQVNMYIFIIICLLII